MVIKNRPIELKHKVKRGRLAIEEWQVRARFILRHLDDPIALQRSPVCRLARLEKIAKVKYPNGIVARGRALRDLAQDCLHEIEYELGDYTGTSRLKTFITLTRQGIGVTEASQLLNITVEHTSRTFKRCLVELFAEKLIFKLR